MHAIRSGLRTGLCATLALAALTACATPAHATGTQFATFTQTTGSPFAFVVADNNQSATFNASTAVTFNFTAASGLDTSNRAANLSLTSQTNAPATAMAIPGDGTFLDQPMNGLGLTSPVVNTLKITDASSRNLVTMTFTGDIAGIEGSSNASLSGDTANGNVVTFTSDFLSFTPGGSFLIGLPTVNPSLNKGSTFLSNFVTDALGSFSGLLNPAVPEPASVTMFGAGMAATAVVAVRRRKRRAGATGA
jgi:hypothetical protein